MRKVQLHDQLSTLQSSYEREILLEYYNAYVEAFQLAWDNRKGDRNTTSSTANNQYYDPLDTFQNSAVEYKENFDVCTVNVKEEFDDITDLQDSFYQQIKFGHPGGNTDETCLSLSHWVHACSSVDPYYHEAFVHMPAQYAKEVKRILYIGGGDNMILREIMKYPDLELVVGLELDQKVSRMSFKNFGYSPYFDDPRVQWWFGDAAKSMLMLPEEYFGSFDLVLVDLLTFVADVIKVTDTLTIMDAATALMKKDGGVIARNEDFSFRTNTKFAKYTVDVEYYDLPIFCEFSLTIGSDSIDFVHATPNDHGIDNVVRHMQFSTKNEGPAASHFDPWDKYRQHKSQSTCDATTVDSINSDVASSSPSTSQNGVLVIVDAENATMAATPIVTIKTKVEKVAAELGFSDIAMVTTET